MRDERRAGFVLVLVIAAIALVGVLLFVLTEGSKTVLFQADAAYLQAVERNLVASGLAWARQRAEAESPGELGAAVELDVTNMNIRDAGLQVTVRVPQGEEPEAEVATSCTRGSRTIRHTDTYQIQISDTDPDSPAN
ncbi:MAG: hypothetical protein JSU70_12995 [Phycisphaerales bacterium]|nr:MAG: hypothetical protein JSU70_12995 [Phycisphaerales bacterium]